MPEDNLTTPDHGNSSEAPFLPNFRRELVSNVVKDICEGRLVFKVDQQGRRPEDIELISGTVGRFVGYINDYVSGSKAGEEFDFLEKQLFFCISTLRTYDALKPNLNEAGIEETLRGLEAKTDTIARQLEEMVMMIKKKDNILSKPRVLRAERQDNKKKKTKKTRERK